MKSSNIDKKTLLEAKSQWYAHQKRADQERHRKTIRIGLAATYTIEPLLPFLGNALVASGFEPDIRVAPYGQIFQACLDIGGTFGFQSDLDVLAIFWRLEDLLIDELEAFLAGDAAAFEKATVKIDDLVSVMVTLRTSFKGILVVNTPPFPNHPLIDLSAINNISSGSRFFLEVTNYFLSRAASLQDLLILDLDGIQRAFGAASAYDTRKWYLYHQPYTEAFYYSVAGHLGRMIKAKVLMPKKCAVVDCDNTLWGGIVGEDGVGGIGLGDDFPGSAYRDFQKILIDWYQKGIFITLCSKNNEDDVWEVFARHDAMVLKKEHVAAWRINWDAKANNMLAIAAELNIGTDSFVFIDDSAFEIEQVRERLPEVKCVQIPEDPARIIDTLKDMNLFESFSLTEEDRSRTKMIIQERERNELKAELSEAEFLESLQLKIDIVLVQDEHVARVTQLINKTNQFNLSVTRRTEEEVLNLLSSDDFRILSMKVQDRFGEYGLTGVAIIECQDAMCRLDTFLLSCRVLGRQAENAFLAQIKEVASNMGCTRIVAPHKPTPKNSIVVDFLRRCKFQESKENYWEAPTEHIPAAPGFIAIES